MIEKIKKLLNLLFIDWLWYLLHIYCICFFSVKPTLKKVSKYENKFAKLQKKAAEFNFRNQLKVVKKKEFTLEEEDKEVMQLEKCKTNTSHIISKYFKI